jgi:hypothetical protein
LEPQGDTLQHTKKREKITHKTMKLESFLQSQVNIAPDHAFRMADYRMLFLLKPQGVALQLGKKKRENSLQNNEVKVIFC